MNKIMFSLLMGTILVPLSINTMESNDVLVSFMTESEQPGLKLRIAEDISDPNRWSITKPISSNYETFKIPENYYSKNEHFRLSIIDKTNKDISKRIVAKNKLAPGTMHIIPENLDLKAMERDFNREAYSAPETQARPVKDEPFTIYFGMGSRNPGHFALRIAEDSDNPNRWESTGNLTEYNVTKFLIPRDVYDNNASFRVTLLHKKEINSPYQMQSSTFLYKKNMKEKSEFIVPKSLNIREAFE